MIKDVEGYMDGMRIGIDHLVEVKVLNKRQGNFIHKMYDMSSFDKYHNAFVYRSGLKYLAKISGVSKSSSIKYKKLMIDLQIMENDPIDDMNRYCINPPDHWMVDDAIMDEVYKLISKLDDNLKVFSLKGAYRDNTIFNLDKMVKIYRKMFSIKENDILKSLIVLSADYMSMRMNNAKEDGQNVNTAIFNYVNEMSELYSENHNPNFDNFEGK